MTKFEAVELHPETLVEMTLEYKDDANKEEALQVFYDAHLQLVERFLQGK